MKCQVKSSQVQNFGNFVKSSQVKFEIFGDLSSQVKSSWKKPCQENTDYKTCKFV